MDAEQAANEFEDAMRAMGIGPHQVGEVFGPIANGAADAFLSGQEELGALVGKMSPGMTDQDKQRVLSFIGGIQDRMGQAYGAAAAAFAAHEEMRANTQVTLFASSVGVKLLPGVIYPLRPRKNGILEAADYEVKRGAVLHRLDVEEEDIKNGVVLVGGTLKFGDDRFSGMESDASLVGFHANKSLVESPMASVFKSSPTENQRFSGQVYLDHDSPQFFRGATLILTDTACTDNLAKWRHVMGRLKFADMAKGAFAAWARRNGAQSRTGIRSIFR